MDVVDDHFGNGPAGNAGKPIKRQVCGYDVDEDGREPAGRNWGDAERAAYLGSLGRARSFSRYLDGGAGGLTLNEQITQAEELVAVTEQAWAEASADLRESAYHTRHQHLAERAGSLTPAERSQYVESMHALAHWRRCEAEYEAARARLDSLLARWDDEPTLADRNRTARDPFWRERSFGAE